MSLNEIMQWAGFVRDLGLILGVPVLIAVGIKLYNQQIEILKARNELLKETQYDRAVTLLKSQKDLFLIERAELEKQIINLGNLVAERDAKLSEVRQAVSTLQEHFRSVMTNAIELNEKRLEALLQERQLQGTKRDTT